METFEEVSHDDATPLDLNSLKFGGVLRLMDRKRVRFVAKEIAHSRPSLDVRFFAAAPIITLFRLFLTIASQFMWSATISDVAIPFLNVTLPPDSRYAVEVPPELASVKSRVWQLRQALHCLRGASRYWQEHFVEGMLGMVFSTQFVCSRACRRFGRGRDTPVARLVFFKPQEF